MPVGVIGRVRALVLLSVVLCAASGCAAGGLFRQQHEYEEDLYLAHDGSVVANVNASVASLVALHGLAMDPDPGARIDLDKTRAVFEGTGARATITLSRRDGRRFVHATVRAENLDALSQLRPFAWSTYRFDRVGDLFQFRQMVGRSAAPQPNPLRWEGTEVVAFKLHLPSVIVFHNAPSRRIERGNILEWEQPLTDRLAGQPVEMEVHMEPESILRSTLLLFGSMILAAVGTLLAAVWWIARRGRNGTPAAHS
jgi:hypothetical protein